MLEGARFFFCVECKANYRSAVGILVFKMGLRLSGFETIVYAVSLNVH